MRALQLCHFSVLLRKPIFVIFQGGGGYGPPVPPLDPHMLDLHCFGFILFSKGFVYDFNTGSNLADEMWKIEK